MALRKYAVLGNPVAHSVSPVMQQAAFRALDIDAVYERVEVTTEELKSCVENLRKQGYSGWNVTVPHKEKIGEYLDYVDETAWRAGSINTVVNRDGYLEGYSTDGYGLAEALRENFNLFSEGNTFGFIGCGGATRACAVYFATEGAGELVLINRTLSKARYLAETVENMGTNCNTRVLTLDDSAGIREALKQSAAVIQATSVGLKENESPVEVDLLPPNVPVYEMIYGNTAFLKGAVERGCPGADGRGMLLHQGAESFRIWTGYDPPVEIMREALYRAMEDK